MKKFSDKMKEDPKKKDPKEQPDDKKVDTRGKNDVQPDGSVPSKGKGPDKPQKDDDKGYSLEDDGKKTDNDKQIADDGDKEAAKDGKSNGTKPELKIPDIDGDKAKPGKAKGGKTQVDLDPELEMVPADELVDESRAIKVVRIAREYKDKTRFESIE